MYLIAFLVKEAIQFSNIVNIAMNFKASLLNIFVVRLVRYPIDNLFFCCCFNEYPFVLENTSNCGSNNIGCKLHFMLTLTFACYIVVI